MWILFAFLLLVMLLAMLVRLIGWSLFIWDYLTRDSDAPSISLFDAIGDGVAQGWAIAWPILYPLICVIGACALGCATVLCMPLVVAFLRRRHKLKVFLSYQNIRAPLASKLSDLMQVQGIEVHFLPFDPTAEHGELNKRVALALDDAEYMVCLPGDKVTYVDSEVFVASHGRKPIVFVVDYPDGHLPNTGSKIYPVLMTQALEASGFTPLVELLRYFHGDWKETLKLYTMANKPIGWVQTFTNIASVLVAVCFVIAFSAMWFGMLALYALEYFYPQAFKIVGLTLIGSAMTIGFGFVFVLVAVQLLVNGVSGVIRRHNVVRAARNALRNGNLTGEQLRAAFTPEGGFSSQAPTFLDALWQESPRAVHEAVH